VKFSEHYIITLAEKLGQLLLKKKLKLVTAESCTGGGVAYAITAISGSSQWFDRGFVTYSNQSKQALLNISENLISTHGAVSEEVVKFMSQGALKNSLADISIAITGIAGPDGGSAEKPVGMIWFGITGKAFPTQTLCNHFSGNREEIRLLAIQEALEFLHKIIT
jgi:nicotinamide-nucleotide amidase